MIPSRIHIVAEAGTNHNGCVETGKRLIDVAVNAAANSVKFQMIFPAGLYLPQFYRGGRYEDSEVFAQRARAALTPDDYRMLAAYAAERGIRFSASAFDREGIALLDELDVDFIKIASCDLNNAPLLRAAAETGRKLAISTGMAQLEEIAEAVEGVYACGNRDIVLMHCVSVYPCPLEQMNLAFIDVLQREFAVPVGLSDHAETSLAAAMAVAKGVTWIEKHITLDRSAAGFDHAYAMEPAAFAAYVNDVSAAAAACQPREQKISAAETEVKRRARRALYAARELPAGSKITEADVLVVRPEGPLPPTALPRVVGQTVHRAVRKYEPLTWEMFTEPACCATAGHAAEVRP
ncbi:MAG: N-acetylneuraminate synthase family protein [Phycisphaerae bacterium]